MNIRNFLVKIGLKGLTSTQKVDKGRNHVAMLTDNAIYPSLQTGLPEISIAWSQPLGDRWFIEPQAALVMPIAYYSIGSEHYNDYHDDTHFHQSDGWTKVGIGVRPSLAVGFNFNDHHAIGIEFAYLFSTIDFGDGIGPDYHAFDVGIFYRLTF